MIFGMSLDEELGRSSDIGQVQYENEVVPLIWNPRSCSIAHALDIRALAGVAKSLRGFRTFVLFC